MCGEVESFESVLRNQEDMSQQKPLFHVAGEPSPSRLLVSVLITLAYIDSMQN